ncbi:restriction endonuclease subunit S [Catalinimonas niigatensis]|uniref:restriction endonuclease subunit S n=1 Tax=Catalinimonas niigatensis TaxID=1397264 RepID=UPI00266502CF|nr:restriction endonuclease subunit S [Catalinimonas niigatensis]WPP48935.1 restriction endonuclease subunit S [Catalinimonas niigatensis]
MDLNDGYKKTDVGIIPYEWIPKTYGEIFQFLTTSSFSRDELTEEGEVRCVHYGDIHTKYHQFLDFSNGFSSFIDLERGKKYPFIKDGDIIMADASEDYSGIGKSVEVKNLGEKPAISGLHTFLLRDKNREFVDGFRAYIHSMTPVKKSMDRLATGLKVYGVSKGNLKTVLVPVPPQPEQQAIATALSDVETLITNLDKLIAKKKAIKQAAMQRLLKSPDHGGQRLPGFEGEWVEVTLGQIISKHQLGGNYPNNEVENSYPLIKMGNLNRGSISLSKLEFISNNIIPNEMDKLKYGDLLFNTRNTLDLVGKISVWRNELNTAFFNSNIMRIEFKEKYIGSTFFMNYLLNTKKYLTALKALATGTTSVAAIYTRDLVKLELLIPSPKEQKAIATILSDMDKEIETLEKKKSKSLRIKQGMMQELLTGRTRLV